MALLLERSWRSEIPPPYEGGVHTIGSLLARVFFTVQLVGSGHVFGLFARFT